jgi:hypothetical protein
MATISSNPGGWPALPYAEWRETQEALHRYIQVVGKVRLAVTPWVNHSWHATLYVTARGLTTSAMYTPRHTFQIDFDFVDHVVEVRTNRPALWRAPLRAGSVAEFRAQLMEGLHKLELDVHVSDEPNEIPDAKAFSRDTAPRPYDSAYAERYWRVLLEADRVFKEFRTGFLGKVSPVHLFWGSLDLAVTRFSGRRAPLHPGGVPRLPDRVTREAYSHEVSSAGFWAGDAKHDASFYSYAYPAPEGFKAEKVEPSTAKFEEPLGEFVLPYARVREAADPNQALLAFLESTYGAAATLGKWDRAELECERGVCNVPRPV